MGIMLDHEKMKRLREKKGLSQADAAKAAGLSSRQHWHLIESGDRPEITLATLDKIAAALGCKAKDLIK
jgi:transcriptional regulator with XRE-family HTH domain